MKRTPVPYQYLKALFQFHPSAMVLNLLLMAILGLLEGIGLFMLVPLLAVSGVIQTASTTTSRVLSFFAQLFDGFDEHRKLVMVLLTYVVIILAHALLRRYQALLNMRIQEGFHRAWAARLHRALLLAHWPLLFDRRSSDVRHVLTTELGRVSWGASLLLQLSISLLVMGVQLLVALLVSLPLSLLVSGCGLALSLLLRPWLAKSGEMGAGITRDSRRLYARVSDHLAGLKEIKCYADEERHAAQFEEIARAIERNRIALTRLQSRTDVFYKAGAALTISLFVYFAIRGFHVRPEQILVLMLVFSRLWPRFAAFQSGLQQLYTFGPALHDVEDLEAACTAAQERRESDLPAGSLTLEHAIEFDRVSFRYHASADAYTIKQASFRIPAHALVALTGASGAGKSTLVDLLLGLLSPESGEIRIDGVRLTRETLPVWRRMIGYVPQTPFLLNASVRENLKWACPNAKEDDMWAALRLVSAEALVRGLPHGLDTTIGDRGMKLSGGERQRVVLARVLLRKPSVLILDEATNALDRESEAAIYQAMETLRPLTTVIIVSHRPAPVPQSTQVMTVEDGRVTMGATTV